MSSVRTTVGGVVLLFMQRADTILPTRQMGGLSQKSLGGLLKVTQPECRACAGDPCSFPVQTLPPSVGSVYRD